MASPFGRIGTGRPTLFTNVCVEVDPQAVIDSGQQRLILSGRSCGCSPLSFVEPTTCPMLSPPPKTNAQPAGPHVLGPDDPLWTWIRGVRPDLARDDNQPVASSSSQRSERSSIDTRIDGLDRTAAVHWRMIRRCCRAQHHRPRPIIVFS